MDQRRPSGEGFEPTARSPASGRRSVRLGLCDTPCESTGQLSVALLLRHASNPVDWWPWGEEAMAEAQRRDVPILFPT
ncbi:DUF255 domain-containing protein [Streptomyces sp. I05A-00742]|uniref:DUF255 domain-containing protein n=1 Tax=Streptomyces sp. I05A-00742 TaxID=2732853 RepID=UPI001BB2260C